MSNNYFAIERNNRCWDHVAMRDQNGNVAFENYLEMTYDEMKSQKDLDRFVTTVMDAMNEEVESNDQQTIVTLIGEDDVFIWSIIMGPGENDAIRYSLLDWKKDGKSYRYAP